MKINLYIQLSPAFLNRLNMNKSPIPNQLIEEIYNIQINNHYKVSQLARFIKVTIRIYNKFNLIDFNELTNYSLKLLQEESNIEQPIIIQEEFEKVINCKSLNTSNDEKFYFKNSEKLKNLMINLYTCSICRIPVCLVGPTGVGKTSMARAFSEILRSEEEDPHIMFSFNMETQIDDLYGTFSFEQGKAIEINGPISNAIEKGKIFIADEFNLAEESVLQTLTIALEPADDDSNFLVPDTGKKIERKKSFFLAYQNDLSTTGRKKLLEIFRKD